MLCDVLARHMTQTRQYVDHPGGHASLAHQFGYFQRGQRCDFRWFEHNGVACGKRRRHLPTGKHQREIPRHHLTHHAQRFTQGVIQKPRIHRNSFALKLVGHATEVPKASCGTRHIEHAAITNGVAGIQRFQTSQFLAIGFNQISQFQQNASPVCGLHSAPSGKRLLRRFHRQIHICMTGHGDLRDHRVVMGIKRGQGLA